MWGGSGSFRELAILINENGKPYYLISKDLGDRVVINSVIIQAREIVLDLIIHAPGDGMCCPTLKKIFRYKLFKDKLEVVEDETADWNTYRNEKYGFEIKYPSN